MSFEESETESPSEEEERLGSDVEGGRCGESEGEMM